VSRSPLLLRLIGCRAGHLPRLAGGRDSSIRLPRPARSRHAEA
jgi:hypothetical protein